VVLRNKFTRENGVKRAEKSESEKFQTSSKKEQHRRFPVLLLFFGFLTALFDGFGQNNILKIFKK
jgi:hypothetical protein